MSVICDTPTDALAKVREFEEEHRSGIAVIASDGSEMSVADLERLDENAVPTSVRRS